MQAWRTDSLSRTKVVADLRDVTCRACGGITTSIQLPARCWAQTLNERTALSQGATSLPFAPKSHNHISESTATTKPMAMQTVKIKSLKIVMPSKTGEGRGRERFSLTLSLGLAAAVLSSSGARLRSFPFAETGGSATGLSATGARDTALAGDAAIISPCGCGLH